MSDIIALDHVEKVYRRDALEIPVLKDITLGVPEGEFLAAFNCMIQFAQSLRGPAFDHRARNVPEITCLLGAWKDVDNDRLIGSQRAMALVVRITALFAPGDNGVARQAARLKNGGADDAPELFGSERRIVVKEPAIAAHLGSSQGLDAFG